MKFRNKKTGEIIDWDCTCINSSLLSAQNRKRLYWVNFGNDIPTLLGKKTCDIPQPENKGISLKDVLESGLSYQEKADCLTARYQGATFPHDYFRNQKTQVAEPINDISYVEKHLQSLSDKLGYVPTLFNAYNEQEIIEKSPTVTTWSGSQTTSASVNIFTPFRLKEYEQSSAQAQRVYSVRGKSVTLNANGGGQGGKTGLYKIDLPDGDYIIRKLTPIECERLQTMPDEFTRYGKNEKDEVVEISKTQRYKCIGNSWTVDVIAYIFSYLKPELDK